MYQENPASNAGFSRAYGGEIVNATGVIFFYRLWIEDITCFFCVFENKVLGENVSCLGTLLVAGHVTFVIVIARTVTSVAIQVQSSHLFPL